MLLVLGIPDPVAARLVRLLADRGERLAVVADAELQGELPEGVEFFEGNAASIDFGLRGPDYRRLVDSVNRVLLVHSAVHCPGEVEKSRAVRQAVEVREFVRAGGAPLGVSYLSSLLVFGSARGTVTEGDFQVGQRFADEHEESLAVAERVIQSLKDQRPLLVLRTAPVVGDEETGELLSGSPLSHLVHLVEGQSHEKGWAFADLPVHFETVGRAAAALAMAQPLSGREVIHLVDEEPLSDRQLVYLIAERLHKLVFDVSPSVRAWTSLSRTTYPGSRALSGWGLHFQRAVAEARISSLLDRDQNAVLEKILPSGPASDA